jgi:hypothetical protein
MNNNETKKKDYMVYQYDKQFYKTNVRVNNKVVGHDSSTHLIIKELEASKVKKKFVSIEDTDQIAEDIPKKSNDNLSSTDSVIRRKYYSLVSEILSISVINKENLGLVKRKLRVLNSLKEISKSSTNNYFRIAGIMETFIKKKLTKYMFILIMC